MERWSLNNREIETINAVSTNVLMDIQKPVQQRDGFHYSDNVVIIPRYFYRFIGINTSEEDYYASIEQHQEVVRSFGKLGVPVLSRLIRAELEPSWVNRFESFWSKLSLFSEIEAEPVVRLLDSFNLFPRFPKEPLQQQIIDNFQGLTEYYFSIFNDQIDPNDFRTFLWDNLAYLHHYVPLLFMDFDYLMMNPTLFAYGDISQNEAFFLVYLSTLGCDVLYFNPQNDGPFSLIDPHELFSHNVVLGYQRIIARPLSAIQTITRPETTAYQASQEIDTMMGVESSLVFKPWQCIGSSIDAVTVKTTYEELRILWSQEALYRPGWSFTNYTAHIPNLFAKVRGTNKDVDAFFEQIHNLMAKEGESTLFSKKFPLPYYNLVSVSHENILEQKHIRNSPLWRYGKLRSDLQDVLSRKIFSYLQEPKVTSMKSPSELRQAILSVLFGLSDEVLHALQAFDYPKTVPKLVVYNDGISGDFSLTDGILLSFLNTLGFDILIYTPSGYSDIELFVYQELFDMHTLEAMHFNLAFREKRQVQGILKKIFSK